MSSYDCAICNSGRAPEVSTMRASGKGTRAIAEELDCTRWAVRTHLSKCEHEEGDSASQGGLISIEDIERPLTSDAEILITLGISPEKYQIVGDVNISARTLVSGDMSYSYRCRVQPISVMEDSLFDIPGWRANLKSANRKTKSKTKESGSTYAIILADQQLGKKHTEQSIENWQNSVIGHVEKAKDLIASGHNIDRAFIGWGGDICEGFANSYANQTATIELNLSQQIEVAYDLSVWTTKYVIDELGLPLTISSTISNHGEWTRNGGKDPITSRGDNIDTHISRLVRSTFERIPGYEAIDWVIADGNPGNVFDLSGIKVYQTHGYIEKGSGTGVEAKVVSAMQKQILGRPLDLGDVKVWLTSHYHHAWMKQENVYTIWGTPALEARMSSEWLFNMNGVWSEPGGMGLVVGKEEGPMGWSNYNIF